MATIEILKSDRDRPDEPRHYPDEPYPVIVRRLPDQSEDSEPRDTRRRDPHHLHP
jgi:hypothetical protein